MPTRASFRTLRTLALLACAGAPASAQNALGDGRALDNNLSPDTRYNAARRDFGTELRFRNAIATGNAPGGLSFRGDVGYASPYEFRGELGSDELFTFRRDSLYSGLAGMGIRGTEAVQYQFALTTGAQLPQNVTGSLTVPRDPASAVLPRAGGTLAERPQYGASIERPGQQVEYRADGSVDTLSLSEGAVNQLRSTSAYTANRGYAPFLLATMPGQEEGSELGVSATPLRGLKAAPMYDPRAEMGLDPRAAAEEPESRLPVERPVTAYEEVLKRIQERAAEQGLDGEREGTQRPEWEQRIFDLREQLLREPARPEVRPDPVPGTEVDLPREIDVPAPGEEDEGEEPTAIDVRFDPETMDLIRESGGRASFLVDPEAESKDPYVIHVRAGERLLEEDKYFDAEERFTKALSVRPGDVTAQMGRVHAQIGAGMFLSAALNLRTAMVGAPTVIATRYADAILPKRERLEDVELALRENVGLAERPGGRLALDPVVERDSALLLAYLGYQRGDAETVRAGLNEFRARVAPTPDRPGSTVDFRLAQLLERVWVLGEPAPGAGEE